MDCIREKNRKHTYLYKIELSENPNEVIYRTYDDFFDFHLMLNGMSEQ